VSGIGSRVTPPPPAEDIAIKAYFEYTSPKVDFGTAGDTETIVSLLAIARTKY
jgi:hypothetical protein